MRSMMWTWHQGRTRRPWDRWGSVVEGVDVQLGDFNGDGSSDITGRYRQAGQWWTGLSTGYSYTDGLWDTWSSSVTWVNVRKGEFA